MKALTDYVAALIDLFEAHAREGRRDVFKMGVGLVVMAGAAGLALIAFGLFLAALFIFITWHLNAALAAVITGVVALVAALIVAEIARWLRK